MQQNLIVKQQYPATWSHQRTAEAHRDFTSRWELLILSDTQTPEYCLAEI